MKADTQSNPDQEDADFNTESHPKWNGRQIRRRFNASLTAGLRHSARTTASIRADSSPIYFHMKRPQVDLEQSKARLRSAGLRATPIRLEVLTVLEASRSPLDAQDVAERLKTQNADRVTVYRTLNSFVEAGLAHRLDPGDRIFRFGLVQPAATATSEPAAPSTGHAHPHFVCDECGTVECLNDSEVTVQTRAPTAGKKTPTFRVKQHEVLLHGTCGECTEPAPQPASRAGSKKASAKRASRAKHV
jgi:Fur family ferric uptake transcriptional regulator